MKKWLMKVAARKATMSIVGYATGWLIAFVASENLATVLSWLGTIGVDITVVIREDVFRPAMAGFGLMAFTLVQDWLSLKMEEKE